MMDALKFLREHASRFNKGIRRVSERRQAWGDFEQRAVSQLKVFAQEAAAENLFEYLYVYSGKAVRKEPGFVTFQWGRHATGAVDFRETGTSSLDVEGGCALHFGQGPSGEVACILYPFASQLRVPRQKYYVYRVFSSPASITDKKLDHATRVMFALAHYSSFAGNPGWDDWCLYTKLRIGSGLLELWHGDWIRLIFDILQKYVAKKVKGLAVPDDGEDDEQLDEGEAADI